MAMRARAGSARSPLRHVPRPFRHQNQSTARGAHIDRLIGGIQPSTGACSAVPVAVVMHRRSCEQVGGVPAGGPESPSILATFALSRPCNPSVPAPPVHTPRGAYVR